MNIINMNRFIFRYFILLISFFLLGCQARQDLAPVEELHWDSKAKLSQKSNIEYKENLANNQIQAKSWSTSVAEYYSQGQNSKQISLNKNQNSNKSQTINKYNKKSLDYQCHNDQQIDKEKQHIVKQNETLYSIAFQNDQDYKDLANFNNLQSPFTLRVGQVLRIAPVCKNYSLKKNNSTKKLSAISQELTWSWPAKGEKLSGFEPSLGKKGIDIAGKQGDKVYAARNGVVAYAGSGLPGYGNLIIIKHDNQFLTAYGNNLSNMVKEGQKIKVGDVIAEMGNIGRGIFGVHFEIRQAGKPVNPLAYLH